jgi:hypothetical protein
MLTDGVDVSYMQDGREVPIVWLLDLEDLETTTGLLLISSRSLRIERIDGLTLWFLSMVCPGRDRA